MQAQQQDKPTGRLSQEKINAALKAALEAVGITKDEVEQIRVELGPRSGRRKAAPTVNLKVFESPDALASMQQVSAYLDLSESSIRRRMEADESFPKPVLLSPRCLRFRASAVAQWAREKAPAESEAV